MFVNYFVKMFAESHSSVGSIVDLRTGGCWFDPRLGQYSFQGLMIVIAIRFIPLSSLSIVSTMVMLKSSQWLGKKYCAEYWLKECRKSMDRCTGSPHITEILLKNGVKHHAINQAIKMLQRRLHLSIKPPSHMFEPHSKTILNSNDSEV